MRFQKISRKTFLGRTSYHITHHPNQKPAAHQKQLTHGEALSAADEAPQPARGAH
ncbi:hypothetical protein Vi05172_g4833 [Venturia inaequalis]|nr:hypothetical protein Vi05172_g4833 [Venturia inaequalis]